MRAVVVGLLLLASVAQGIFGAGGSRIADRFIAGESVVVDSSPRPCLDGHESRGSRETPCGDAGPCCILCVAAVSDRSAEISAGSAILPAARPGDAAPAARHDPIVHPRPAGWVSSWSAQAPPVLS